MSKSLSILIPTLPARLPDYMVLVQKLKKQIKDNCFESQIQLVSLMDTKEMTIGEKRNHLMSMAVGRYLVFIDDDDGIADNYINRLMFGIAQGMDCVTFCGEYWENGNYHSDFKISTSVYANLNQPKLMLRKPNHICAVKSDIAKRCQFPHKQVGEDSSYSEQISKHIKTEYHLAEKLYFYKFDSKSTQTQNNIAREYD